MEFMEEGSLEKVIDAFPRIKMTEKQIAYVCFEVHSLVLFFFFWSKYWSISGVEGTRIYSRPAPYPPGYQVRQCTHRIARGGQARYIPSDCTPIPNYVKAHINFTFPHSGLWVRSAAN